MNKHDQKRNDDLVKSLRKAKEQAEEAALYLAANDRPVEQIYEVEDNWSM